MRVWDLREQKWDAKYREWVIREFEGFSNCKAYDLGSYEVARSQNEVEEIRIISILDAKAKVMSYETRRDNIVHNRSELRTETSFLGEKKGKSLLFCKESHPSIYTYQSNNKQSKNNNKNAKNIKMES